jgi:hypothetical protein
VGGGKPALQTQTRLNFELVGERRFRSGVVFLHYRNSVKHSNENNLLSEIQ